MAFTLEHLTSAEAGYYIFVYSLIFSSLCVLSAVLLRSLIVPFIKLCIVGCVDCRFPSPWSVNLLRFCPGFAYIALWAP